jgi:predicted small lipoprotein YifL
MALTLLLLTGCGQKGPLYLPSAAQPQASANIMKISPALQVNPVPR